MQLFVDGLSDQADRYSTDVELVLVDWNPPADRPSLAEALVWPAGSRLQPVVVTVPAAVHRSLPHSDRLPFFQMIAKNVGIRRARAPFVLATNIDILFSDELFLYMRDSLRADAMYRADRSDIVAPLDRRPPPTPAECRALPVLRKHGPAGTTYPGGGAPPARRLTGVTSLRDTSRVVTAVWDRLVLPKLHTSACGDFTLASHEIWESLRGYPEWPMFSWQLDGLPLYQAYAAGIEIVNLPEPLVAFHLEHSAGSGWTPEGSRHLFARLKKAGIPYLSTAEYRRHARAIVRAGRHVEPFNGQDWGMAPLELAVTAPGPRAATT